MAAAAQNVRDLLYYQTVSLRSEYATQVLDKNHTGLQIIKVIFLASKPKNNRI
jgi:hypothetical protein